MKTRVLRTLPEGMQEVVDVLKQSHSKEECLRRAYDFLITKYHGGHLKTLSRLPEFFEHDLDVLWKKVGFLHCTNMNIVLRTLLVKSGFFVEEDIRTRWTLLWYISPHQYLEVRVDEKGIAVDVWAHTFGITFGDYAHGFHSASEQ